MLVRCVCVLRLEVEVFRVMTDSETQLADLYLTVLDTKVVLALLQRVVECITVYVFYDAFSLLIQDWSQLF